MSKIKNLMGRTFGRITVIGTAPSKKRPNGRFQSAWTCRCVCGKEKIVVGNSLTQGNTKSCGCLLKELSSLRMSGANNPAWKGGGRKINKHGYAYFEPCRRPGFYLGEWAFEHTVVMSEKIGRQLLPNENVHHKNGIRDDNRIENLELWAHGPRPGQRVEDLVSWAREILIKYSPRELAHER